MPDRPVTANDTPFRFDPVDLDQIRLLSQIPAGRRIQAMLDARELAVGLTRGCLRRQHPDPSLRELNLKALEEIERVQQIPHRALT
jgi:hypothetical protein